MTISWKKFGNLSFRVPSRKKSTDNTWFLFQLSDQKTWSTIWHSLLWGASILLLYTTTILATHPILVYIFPLFGLMFTLKGCFDGDGGLVGSGGSVGSWPNARLRQMTRIRYLFMFNFKLRICFLRWKTQVSCAGFCALLFMTIYQSQSSLINL